MHVIMHIVAAIYDLHISINVAQMLLQLLLLR
jgi:hypothetical protein